MRMIMSPWNYVAIVISWHELVWWVHSVAHLGEACPHFGSSLQNLSNSRKLWPPWSSQPAYEIVQPSWWSTYSLHSCTQNLWPLSLDNVEMRDWSYCVRDPASFLSTTWAGRTKKLISSGQRSERQILLHVEGLKESDVEAMNLEFHQLQG